MELPHEPAQSTTQPLDFSKETVNVIRTTLRNYIELTSIADNKANVLLSLNAVMIAFVVPLAISNLEVIFTYALWIPLFFLAVTCFATIYFTTMVLVPKGFEKFNDELPPGMPPSPFFFGTIQDMSLETYFTYLHQATQDKHTVRQHLSLDLFYIGRRLGEKMTLMRRSFLIFRLGIFLTLLATGMVLLLDYLP
jgi:hypothetical protein